MTRKTTKLFIIGLTLALGLILAACGSATPVATVEPTPCPTAAPCPAAPDLAAVVPFQELWANSGHAKADSAAFTHWNEADPKSIPVGCAKCHSSAGFVEFVGTGAIANPIEVGSVITCKTCHNDVTAKLTSVTFPSGAVISGLGKEAVCMTCHQGTASGASVDAAIQKVGATDDDKPVADLGFTNIHYFAAAVSRYGTLVKGGYEYPGKQYDALWNHVDGVNTCTDCHDSHSLEVKVELCATCHTGVKTAEDLKAVRMASSQVDYDGDGDVKEGIASEIDGLRAILYTAIQAYAKDVAGTPIVYDAATYPYFFIDTNANGTGDKDELAFPNAYKSWTPRLAKAAFNYQTSVKDPGAFAHGAKYIIQLIYDSTEDLNSKLPTPIDLSKTHRNDPGHFAGSEMAFRDWDAEGAVPAGCSKCHSATGLPQFIKEGTNISNPISDGFTCETCHNDLATYTRYEITSVTFPSGAKVAFEKSPDDNLCLTCHQGRESKASVDKAIGKLGPDEVSDKLSFRNIHYFAAGATLFGTEVKGLYEFDGKEYAGRFVHPQINGDKVCTGCHDAHMLTAKVDACKGCHQVDSPELIRGANSTADYDGDGDVKEGLKGEIDTLNDKLLAAIQAYATSKIQKPIAYSPVAYPYWFNDTNSNGIADPDEAKMDNRYASWTPTLLKSAYNLQASIKDPAGYVHNAKYMIQILIDSIANVGGDVAGMTRP